MKSSSNVIRGVLAGPPVDLADSTTGGQSFSPYPAGPARVLSGPPLLEARLAEAFQSGRAEGIQEGQARAQAELDGARATLEMLVRDLWARREELYREVEPDVVRLALEVARRVVGDVARREEGVVEKMVSEALRRVQARDRVVLRVNPEELEAVRGQREKWIQLLEGVEHFEIMEDRRVPRGGAVATTLYGSVDARWSTQLDEIERALLGERHRNDADA